MINLEKIKLEKRQTPFPLVRGTAPALYFYPLFYFFRFPPRLRAVIKTRYPPPPTHPSKKGGV